MLPFLSEFQPYSSDAIAINIHEVVGDGICVASSDGEKVCSQIAAAFREGKSAILSFQNVEETTPAFLSTAIGHLYAIFPEEQIRSSLKVVDINPDDAEDIEYVVADTKEYLQDPQRFINAMREVLGDDYV